MLVLKIEMDSLEANAKGCALLALPPPMPEMAVWIRFEVQPEGLQIYTIIFLFKVTATFYLAIPTLFLTIASL